MNFPCRASLRSSILNDRAASGVELEMAAKPYFSMIPSSSHAAQKLSPDVNTKKRPERRMVPRNKGLHFPNVILKLYSKTYEGRFLKHGFRNGRCEMSGPRGFCISRCSEITLDSSSDPSYVVRKSQRNGHNC